MANPKITITLDQSMLDAINSGVAMLNRLADALAGFDAVKIGDEIVTGPGKLSEPAADVPAPTTTPHTPVMPEPIMPAPVTTQQPPFQMPTMQPAAAQPVSPAPVMPTQQAPEYTMEQLGRAGAELMTRGVNASAVLQEFGIMSLDALPKEQYGAFAQRLRQLGANI